MNLVLPGRTRIMNEHFLPDTDLAQIRLLIVEDDPFLQSYLSEILLDYPLQVFIADSIREALFFYDQKQPDILLIESHLSFTCDPSQEQMIEKKVIAGGLHIIVIAEDKTKSIFNSRAKVTSQLTKPLVPTEVTRIVMSLAERIALKKILG